MPPPGNLLFPIPDLRFLPCWTRIVSPSPLSCLLLSLPSPHLHTLPGVSNFFSGKQYHVQRNTEFEVRQTRISICLPPLVIWVNSAKLLNSSEPFFSSLVGRDNYSSPGYNWEGQGSGASVKIKWDNAKKAFSIVSGPGKWSHIGNSCYYFLLGLDQNLTRDSAGRRCPWCSTPWPLVCAVPGGWTHSISLPFLHCSAPECSDRREAAGPPPQTCRTVTPALPIWGARFVPGVGAGGEQKGRCSCLICLRTLICNSESFPCGEESVLAGDLFKCVSVPRLLPCRHFPAISHPRPLPNLTHSHTQGWGLCLRRSGHAVLMSSGAALKPWASAVSSCFLVMQSTWAALSKYFWAE